MSASSRPRSDYVYLASAAIIVVCIWVSTLRKPVSQSSIAAVPAPPSPQSNPADDPKPKPNLPSAEKPKIDHIDDDAHPKVSVGPTPENLKEAGELYIPSEEFLITHPDGFAIAWIDAASWEKGRGSGAAQKGEGKGLVRLEKGTRVAAVDPGMLHMTVRVLTGEHKGGVFYLDIRDLRKPWRESLGKVDSPPVVFDWPSRADARDFLQSMLAELDGFKNTPEFREWGFSIGGPYNKWLKAVENKSEDKTAAQDGGFTHTEKEAVFRLRQLGMEYRSEKGKETKFAVFARQVIEKVIARNSLSDPPKLSIEETWRAEHAAKVSEAVKAVADMERRIAEKEATHKRRIEAGLLDTRRDIDELQQQLVYLKAVRNKAERVLQAGPPAEWRPMP